MPEKVEIPDKIYEKFGDRAAEKGLDSADEYVNYVLEQIYEKLQAGESEYSEEEAEKVKEKLKGLGYLD